MRVKLTTLTEGDKFKYAGENFVIKENLGRKCKVIDQNYKEIVLGTNIMVHTM